MADIKENNSNVINRFLRYIKVDTQSASKSLPGKSFQAV